MSTLERQPLDQVSVQVLVDILKMVDPPDAGVDAVHYRAQHENQLEVLDNLERLGYLRKDHGEKYWVSLCALPLLDDLSAHEVLERCEKIFPILRNHYKSKPRQALKVLDLAPLVGFSFEETVECLHYMVEGHFWGGYSLHTPNRADAHIQASESILKYKMFQDVVAEIERERGLREAHYLAMRKQVDRESPVDAVASAALQHFDSEHVSDIWRKALDRRYTDPDGAITAARSLLEAVCKLILDEEGVEYDEKANLPKLYGLAAKQLNLAPSQSTERVFKQILGGCQAVVEGVGGMRNRLSDSHGKGKSGVKPAPRHAELAVNLAGTLATFLIETWEARKRP